jgi:hypothetical protein
MAIMSFALWSLVKEQQVRGACVRVCALDGVRAAREQKHNANRLCVIRAPLSNGAYFERALDAVVTVIGARRVLPAAVPAAPRARVCACDRLLRLCAYVRVRLRVLCVRARVRACAGRVQTFNWLDARFGGPHLHDGPRHRQQGGRNSGSDQEVSAFRVRTRDARKRVRARTHTRARITVTRIHTRTNARTQIRRLGGAQQGAPQHRRAGRPAEPADWAAGANHGAAQSEAAISHQLMMTMAKQQQHFAAASRRRAGRHCFCSCRRWLWRRVRTRVLFAKFLFSPTN